MQPPSPRAARIPNPRIRRTSCSISRAERTWRHPHSPTTTRTTPRPQRRAPIPSTATPIISRPAPTASSTGSTTTTTPRQNPKRFTEAFFIGTTGAYIELPAISGKALSKVILTGASGASGDSEAAITDTAGADIAGGLSQVVGKGEATYDLSGTVANTSYRITVTKKNCQFAKIELFYGEGGGSTPVQPTLSVNPTSLSFAAKDQAKTIACTVANADGYTVGTSSSDAANFAASAAGTTVTVTPTENTGGARNATVTVYLTNDGGATKVAAKTVAVTQAAAGGSEPAGDTYDKITKVAELVNGMTGFIGCEPGGTYGLQLVTGFTDYGQGFTAAYTYDETKRHCR